MTQRTFEVNTEPHVATIGDHQYAFPPEVDTDTMMSAWSKSRVTDEMVDEAVAEHPDWTKGEARSRLATTSIRTFIDALMVDDDTRARFAAHTLPDRVLIDMQNWLLEEYGFRPTGSSSDFSTPSLGETPSTASTDDSSSEGSTA